MDQRAITPVEAIEFANLQERVNYGATVDDETDDNAPDAVQDHERGNNSALPSPEPESGIGKDVDSCDSMSPDGDLGKGDDTKSITKTKTRDDDDDIMNFHPPTPEPLGSEDEDEYAIEEDTQYVAIVADDPKPTSKPPRFNNSVDPYEYEVHVPRAPRGGGGGGFGRHFGRGPRKAVVVIVAISVVTVALVVGLVLAADLPPPPESARLYGRFVTTNLQFIDDFTSSKPTEETLKLYSDFKNGMKAFFTNSTFEDAYNDTAVEYFLPQLPPQFLSNVTIDFSLGVTFLFDNDTMEYGENGTTLPMVTTTIGTTMEMPVINDDTPLWVARILYFVYETVNAMGSVADFDGTLTYLDITDPADIVSTSPVTTTASTTMIATSATTLPPVR